MAMAATFRTPRSAPVRYVWAELGCYLLFVLAGQIAFAFLASVPLPILESNAVLPAYLAAWTVCHLSELVHDLFAWSGLAWIRRAAGVGMAGLGITVFGIDWAAASGPTAAFRASAVAGLTLAIVPCIAAVVLNAVLHLAWGAHPASARQPLPYAWTPDYSFRDIHVVVWVAAAYYLLVDPHGYAEDALDAAGFDGRAIHTSVTYLITPVTARSVDCLLPSHPPARLAPSLPHPHRAAPITLNRALNRTLPLPHTMPATLATPRPANRAAACCATACCTTATR